MQLRESIEKTGKYIAYATLADGIVYVYIFFVYHSSKLHSEKVKNKYKRKDRELYDKWQFNAIPAQKESFKTSHQTTSYLYPYNFFSSKAPMNFCRRKTRWQRDAKRRI